MRRGNRSDFLLSGVIRCGRCKRAYVGMSAKGNGGVYHYYACSGRQKLGRKGCDGERLNRDKLEAAVLSQLANLYRDSEPDRERAPARLQRASVRIGRRSKNNSARSRKRSAARSVRSTATTKPSSRATSNPASSRPGSPTSRRSSTPSASRSTSSPRSSPTQPTRFDPQRSSPSPTGSATRSPPANPNRPRRCSGCSSKSSASTADRRSSRPTASSHPRFAQLQVQWAHLGSNQGPLACEASALPLSYAPGRVTA